MISWGIQLSSKCILVLGGARSGKSKFAQEMAERTSSKVLFVATAEGLDGEMQSRIQEHKRLRPHLWRTLEASRRVGEQIAKCLGDAEVVLVDCLTLLVSNVLTGSDPGTSSDAESAVMREIEELMEAVDEADAVYIIVSNELGMGLVPANPLGREYRDLLGKANQFVAARADEVYFMMAGIPCKVK